MHFETVTFNSIISFEKPKRKFHYAFNRVCLDEVVGAAANWAKKELAWSFLGNGMVNISDSFASPRGAPALFQEVRKK